MKVRIGITETSKVVELEADDEKSFKKELEKAVAAGGIAWFTDTKGRTVGIPAANVAFVEMEATEDGPAVGFAPAV
jgi:hypothetical protein